MAHYASERRIRSLRIEFTESHRGDLHVRIDGGPGTPMRDMSITDAARDADQISVLESVVVASVEAHRESSADADKAWRSSNHWQRAFAATCIGRFVCAAARIS
jgi:hypothetical protein